MDVASGNGARTARPSPARAAMLALIGIAAMPNGLFFSPWFDSVLFMVPRAASALLVTGEAATFYLTGAFLWLLTLVLAGIPAALYERLRGLRQPTFGAQLIWLVAALALCIPSFQSLLELLAEPG